MSTIDSQLAQLQDQYDRVFARYTAGELTAQQASQEVSQMTVTDAAGVVWGLTPQKMWWSAQPGGPRMEPADPSLFAAAATFGPPAGFGPVAEPHPAFGPAAQPAQPAAMPTPAPFPNDVFSTPVRQLGDDDNPAPKQRKAKSAGKPSLSVPSMSGITERLPQSLRNRRTLIVAAVALVLVVAAFMLRPSSSAPEAAAPVASEQPAQTTSPAPSAEDVSRVVETIRSGDLSAVVVGDKGPVLSQAAWAGTKAAGLQVSPGPVSKDNTQEWIVATSDGKAVTTVKVQWVSADGAWKVDTLPSVLP